MTEAATEITPYRKGTKGCKSYGSEATNIGIRNKGTKKRGKV